MLNPGIVLYFCWVSVIFIRPTTCWQKLDQQFLQLISRDHNKIIQFPDSGQC